MPDESTTPDLVELTRQCFEAATRLDLDSMISLYDRDRIAWDVRPMGLLTITRQEVHSHALKCLKLICSDGLAGLCDTHRPTQASCCLRGARLLSAHSKTVGAEARMPVRTRKQGWEGRARAVAAGKSGVKRCKTWAPTEGSACPNRELASSRPHPMLRAARACSGPSRA